MAIRNLDRLNKKLGALPENLRKDIGKALLAGAVQLDGYAKKQIQGGTRSGRVYRRRTVTHQASAPGEYPKTDRGQLVASLYFKLFLDSLTAVFGTKLDYGKYLEFGTGRMLPRPWLRPTVQANRKAIVQRVREAVRDALKRERSRG